MRRAVVVLLATWLAACATAPEREPSGAEDQATPDEPLDTEGSVEHNVDNRAVAMLWDKAEQARRDDRLEEAARHLERALRLAPEDPVLWSRLAEVRLRQKKFAVAENIAAKSNALAGEQRLLRYRNWLIIAEARRRRGDESGAQEAREQAEKLRGARS